MKTFKNIILLCIICPLFLTGCFDKIELEERGLVLAIGVDKYSQDNDTNIEKTGEEKRFIVSIAMPDVSESEKTEDMESPMDKEATQQSINEAVKKGEGSSITTTLNLIDNYVTKNLYYGHTKVVVLGREVLEDRALVQETIDALERNKDISRKTIIVGTQGRAEDILQTIPRDEKMIGIYINDFYKYNEKDSPFTFRVDLEDLIQDLLSTGDTVIPNISLDGRDIKIGGLLVLKDYEYVGFLDDILTKGLLWLIDKKALGELSVPFEDVYVSIRTSKKSIDENIYEKDNKIYIDFDLYFEGKLSEYSLGKKIMLDTEKYKMLEIEFAEYINSQIESSIYRIRNLNVDLLGLKEMVRKNEYDLYEKYNLKENNIYDYVELNINTEVSIKGSGTVK